MLLGEHEKGVKAVEGADLVGAAELENEQEAALVGEIDLLRGEVVLRSGKAAVFVWESILACAGRAATLAEVLNLMGVVLQGAWGGIAQTGVLGIIEAVPPVPWDADLLVGVLGPV